MSNPDRPNMRQAALWNDASGKTWVELRPMLDEIMAPLERLVVDAGYPGAGGCVLDIGCGAGATTLAMARRLGEAGRCTGLDISQALVSAARARAQRYTADDMARQYANLYEQLQRSRVCA